MTDESRNVPDAVQHPSATLDPLVTAMKLLRVCVSAFGDENEPSHGPADLDDVNELIAVARSYLEPWLSKVDPCHVSEAYAYDGLDMLTLAAAVINAELEPRNSFTISPLRCAIIVAVEKLELAIQAIQPGNDDGTGEPAESEQEEAA